MEMIISWLTLLLLLLLITISIIVVSMFSYGLKRLTPMQAWQTETDAHGREHFLPFVSSSRPYTITSPILKTWLSMGFNSESIASLPKVFQYVHAFNQDGAASTSASASASASNPGPFPYPSILSLDGCIGLTIDEIGEGRLDKAPFLNYKFIMQDIKDVHDRLASIMDELFLINKRAIDGPIYILLSSKNEGTDIDARFYFPSYTSRGVRYPNISTLSRQHRWMKRILSSQKYNFPFNSSSSRELAQCARFCPRDNIAPFSPTIPSRQGYITETSYQNKLNEQIDKEVARYESSLRTIRTSARKDKRQELYCGCVNCTNDDPYKTPPQKMDFYTIYRLNQAESEYKRFFSSSSITTLLVNALYTNAKMEEGCQNMLVSPNQQYALTIVPNEGIAMFRVPVQASLTALSMHCYLQNKLPDGSAPVWLMRVNGSKIKMEIADDGTITITSEINGAEKAFLTVPPPEEAQRYQAPFCIALSNQGKLVFVDASDNILSAQPFLPVIYAPPEPSSDSNAAGPPEQTTLSDGTVATQRGAVKTLDAPTTPLSKETIPLTELADIIGIDAAMNTSCSLEVPRGICPLDSSTR